MNKKLNTVVFFMVATIVNLAIVLVLVVALLVPYLLLVGSHVPAPTNVVALIVIVLASLAISFPLYNRLLGWVRTKIDFEKTFDPIVTQEKKRRR